MKYFKLVILVISVFSFVNAQDTIRIEDILNKIKKEGSNTKVNKENDPNNQSDDVLNLFREAIEPYVYKCEVQYTITKDNKEFGKDDAEYFGKLVGYAINTDGGLIVDNTMLKPWESDSDFKEYKSEYQPKIYKIKINGESDKDASLILNEDKITLKETNKGFGLIEIKDSKFKAIELASSKEPKGFIVFYNNSKEKNSKNAKASSAFFKPNWINGKAQIAFKTDNFDFGFYFSIFPKNGNIEIKLSGITSTNDKGQIELVQVKEIETNDRKPKANKETQDKKGKVPLKEIKGNKK